MSKLKIKRPVRANIRTFEDRASIVSILSVADERLAKFVEDHVLNGFNEFYSSIKPETKLFGQYVIRTELFPDYVRLIIFSLRTCRPIIGVGVDMDSIDVFKVIRLLSRYYCLSEDGESIDEDGEVLARYSGPNSIAIEYTGYTHEEY